MAAAAANNKCHMSLLEADGGYVIPISSKVGKELREAYKKTQAKYGTHKLLPVWVENGVYNFYLKDVKSTSGAAQQVALYGCGRPGIAGSCWHRYFRRRELCWVCGPWLARAS